MSRSARKALPEAPGGAFRFRTALAAAWLALCAVGAGAADVTRIEALAGTVDIQREPDGAWVAATVGAEVPEGGSVRTSGDGRAEVRYPDGTKIWLKESTQISIEAQRSLLSRLAIGFGSIKARVTHMSRNRRMEFKTTTAVAAVRGTEITITQNPDGKFDLNVLFGKVELRIAGVARTVDVSQGHGYGVDGAGTQGKDRLLTRSEEVQGLMRWDPGMDEEKRIERLEENEQRRAEIHEFARNEESRKDQLDALIGRQKEEDLAAGRTLIDVHGNLVRVDQRLLRPAPDEIQIVNLVKRPSYVYTDKSWDLSYNGNSQITNRLDAAQVRIKFDGKLPEELAAWSSFFADHEPLKQEIILTNQTNPFDIFTIAYRGDRDPVTGELDLDELWTGAVTCAVAKDCLAGITDFSLTSQLTKYKTTGTSCSTASLCNPVILGSAVNPPDELMIEVTGNKWVKDVGGSTSGPATLWVGAESYVINNDGGIRASTDFTDTSSDPLSLFKESAFETILYLKTQGLGNSMSFNDISFTGGRNIDLVFAPDLGLALLQKIIADVDKLGTN